MTPRPNPVAAASETAAFPCSEAAHDARIESIARDLIANRDAVRLVLIGGPSSAGKTTFAKRLCWHLEQAGASTLAVSTDDFFVGDALNPRDEKGNLDYEHIKAINLDLLNSNLADLLAGRIALMPKFDFHVHAPMPERHEARLPDGAFIIIEGLHSLNPALTPAIPDGAKHLILADTITNPYAPAGSVRPQLHSKPAHSSGAARTPAVPSGAQRLIRRIIRDAQYRGRGAAETILLWTSVVAGEERWIRPFVGNADETFDTSIPDEPGILRPFAEPALAAIGGSSPAYATAQGLLHLMAPFAPKDATDVPSYSILREYIGGSSIQY
ncbi:MAG: nucleoside kinase [Kiritimatiellae bacterium]|nr:nucleoside kinase [Kiritimatiellia bacterium]